MNYNKLTAKMALNLAAPHTWAASICPSLFGCFVSYLYGYKLPLWQFAALVLACILMQSSVNTLNDYIDYVKGADSKDNNLERSDAVLLYENINPKSALVLGIGFLAVAVALGVILIASTKCLIPLWIGIIGAAAIVLYSGGKTPISYLPLGELISGLVMGGLIPLGCIAVASGELHLEVLIFSIPFIISIGLIMLSNNGCDIDKDIEAGRRTLPVLLGRAKTQKLFTILMYIWIFSLLILPIFLIGILGMLVILLAFFIGRKAVFKLFDSQLDQAHRIEQMKRILAANIVVNGSYIAVLAFVDLLLFIKREFGPISDLLF